MNVIESPKNEAKKGKKAFTGTVVSTKMQKTIAVLVERLEKNERYGKFVKKRKKFLAHVPDELSCKEGDVVSIEETRPYSSRKTFILKSVVKSVGEA